MKRRYIPYRRKPGGLSYIEDFETQKQENLGTKDRAEAISLLNARNESACQPRLNIQIARTYLAASDHRAYARNLEVDLSKRLVLKNGDEVKLTPIEYSLLRLLVTHAGRVLTHRQLLTEVWGEKAIGQSHYLRVHLAHLREKLEANPSAPEMIVTEPAVGHRLVLRN